MDARTVVLIAAMGLGALGCADAGDQSTAAVPSDTPATVPPTTVPPTTVAPTTVPNPVPRALGTATRAPLDAATAPLPIEDDALPRRASEVEVGECLDVPGLRDPEVTQLVDLEVIDCAEPHDAEVFARISLDDEPEAPYPGDEHVRSAADQVCFERFEAYVGIRYVDARLEIVHLRPPVAAWVRGDRIVTCLLVNATAEPLLGSMAGTQ
jgi:hypothetical protein